MNWPAILGWALLIPVTVIAVWAWTANLLCASKGHKWRRGVKAEGASSDFRCVRCHRVSHFDW